jgi:protein SDA1
LTQYNHYLSLLRVYSLGQSSSTSNDKSDELFEELITFICQVAQCYPEDTKELPAQLKALLLGESGSGGAARGEVRKTIVKNLVMLRNKDIVDSVQ